MDDFRGETAQYERLRAALRELYDLDIKSAELETLAEKEAKRLRTDWMTRTDIDKFRRNEVAKPRTIQRIIPLWNIVFSPEFSMPTADRSGPARSDGQSKASDGLHQFYHSSLKFFDAHEHTNIRVETYLPGRFVFYHFSEYFHRFSASVPRAVVIGQWDIEFADGACCVAEKQEYDGNIGKQRMRDAYNGYCLPKGPNICFILRQAKKKTPKFYMLDAHYDNLKTMQTEVLAGHMLKGSEWNEFFHSPVYAVRVPDSKDVDCNILPCSGVSELVMHELDALSSR